MEIERKFLVRSVPNLTGRESSRIEQGYLALADSEGGAEVRLRRRNGDRSLTVKSAGTMARVEEEIDLDLERFEALWPLTEGRRVYKTRYLLPAGDLTIELDVYEEELAGLAVAEVEFSDEASAETFEPPEWLGVDVTANPAYRNETLATRGAPT